MTATPPRNAPSGGLATQHAPPLDLPFRFMATALVALAVLAVFYPLHLPLLLGSFYDPHLISFVHVNTLGVVGATILGASFQLLPVVLQAPLASVRLARLAWWPYAAGLVAFALGLSLRWLPLLAVGSVLIYVAIALYAVVAALTLVRTPAQDVVYWHIAAAVAGLIIAATLGLLLALSKAIGFLAALTFPVLAAHIALMVGGWITPMLTGVAYRLVGMFTLSEDQLRPSWAWSELILTVAGAWVLSASFLLGLGTGLSALGTALLLVGLGLFAAQLLRLYRLRRRRVLDVHMPFALTAVACGLLAAALALWGFAAGRGPGDPVWIAIGWLAIAGWAETAIQGFLYKIGTFLTWLNRYARLAGRQKVPKLEDLYGRRTALAGWALWALGLALTTALVLGRFDWLVYPASAALTAGLAAFLVNAVRVGRHWTGRPAAQLSPLSPLHPVEKR